MKVPSEESINEILDRYKEINEHAASYTWKRLGNPLGILVENSFNSLKNLKIDMEKTLEENDIFDETDQFEMY